MKNYFKYFCCIICICVYFGCAKNTNKSNAMVGYSDSVMFYQLLKKGDSIYALGQSFETYAQSLLSFDSAKIIADYSNNNLLKAEADFAFGRIYDAWNKEPLKTIEYFIKAVDGFKKIEGKYIRAMYAKTLLVTAHEKNSDSINVIKTINEILDEVKPLNIDIKSKMSYLVELMVICTNIKNYKLAEKINTDLLKSLTINNDSLSINYKDHYILAKSRLDIYYKNKNQTANLDSLVALLPLVKTTYDSIFYSNEIYLQYAHLKNFPKAYNYLVANKELSLKTFSLNGVSTMQNVLLQTEIKNAEKQKELEKEKKKRNEIIIWILGAFAFAITLLSFIIYSRNKKYKILTKELLVTNKNLDDKIAQNVVLNKEIHHRVKNNLQMIFSLLHMQERTSQNEETILHLQAARSRIESIASLHEQLMYNEIGTQTSYKLHITQLISGVLESFLSEKKIISNLDIDDVMMPASQSFALSLILNEWITNTVKYAKGENNVLEIFMGLKTLNNKIIITYSDNGKLNKDDLLKDGLGTNIVSLLCKQMNGQLTTLNNNPFNYHLLIPKSLTV